MRSSLGILILLFCTIIVLGQEPAAENKFKKSTDKVKIDGKYYYIHILTKSETINSLSKPYNTS